MIHRSRIRKYPTASEFYKSKNLSCTYQRYVNIEKGYRPSIKLALEIIEALSVDESSALYAWVRDLMPDEKRKGYFVDLGAQEEKLLSSIQISQEHAELFADDPVYFELLGYISMYSHRRVSIKELSKTFKMTPQNIKERIRKLNIYNLVQIDEKKLCFINSDSWVGVPEFDEFLLLRRKNFVNGIESHFSSNFVKGKTIEHITTRLVTDRQIVELNSKIRSLLNWFWSLPNPLSGEKPYSLCIAGNNTRFGNSKINLLRKKV